MDDQQGTFETQALAPAKSEDSHIRKGRPKKAFSKSERQEFFLPVSGFVWFYREEMRIINHPAFQRLNRINQLGQANYVYRGATHKRIEHVLGVVGVAQKIISAVKKTSDKGLDRRDISYAPELTSFEQLYIRLGALLHDIGHLACGHTLEDELEIIGKHDADARLDLIFLRTNWDGAEVPSLSSVIDEIYTEHSPKSLLECGLTPTDIVRLLIRKQPKEIAGKADEEIDPMFFSKNKILKDNIDVRYHLCSNIIGNTICADLLDYIYRDWYHIGKIRSFDDRIFQYMEIRRQFDATEVGSVSNDPEIIERSADDRFVISLRTKSKLRTDGVSTILNLLEWRYELAEAVLFHRTKISAGAMLDRALYALWGDAEESVLIDKIIDLSDEQLLDFALGEASNLRGRNEKNSGAIASSLIRKLKSRDLYKIFVSYDQVEFTKGKIDKIKDLYCGGRGKKGSGAKNRSSLAEEIEKDWDLSPGSMVVYCTEVKAKLAEVSIAIDNQILPFNKYEAENSNELSGGHLKAQESRFENLWKIHIFIDEAQLASLPETRRAAIKRSIRQLALEPGTYVDLLETSKGFARSRVTEQNDKTGRKTQFVDDLPAVARSDSSVSSRPRYPNGAECIRNFIKPK